MDARKNAISVLDRKYTFCQFKLKFCTQTNSNMQNSMVMFTFSVFDRKYPFWTNLISKFKIVSLEWNLICGLIRICWIQWWCSLFRYSTANTLLDKFDLKIQNCFFKVKFDVWANSNMQNSMVMFAFSIFDRKDSFRTI